MNFDHLGQCQVPREVKCTHCLSNPSDDAWLQMFPSCLRREQGRFAANDALFWLKETSPRPCLVRCLGGPVHVYKHRIYVLRCVH